MLLHNCLHRHGAIGAHVWCCVFGHQLSSLQFFTLVCSLFLISSCFWGLCLSLQLLMPRIVNQSLPVLAIRSARSKHGIWTFFFFHAGNRVPLQLGSIQGQISWFMKNWQLFRLSWELHLFGSQITPFTLYTLSYSHSKNICYSSLTAEVHMVINETESQEVNLTMKCICSVQLQTWTTFFSTSSSSQ